MAAARLEQDTRVGYTYLHCAVDGFSAGRHRGHSASADPPLHTPPPRQSRALQPDPGRRTPLRPTLPIRSPTSPGHRCLEHPRHLSSTPHRLPRPATRITTPHKRQQRHAQLHLTRNKTQGDSCSTPARSSTSRVGRKTEINVKEGHSISSCSGTRPIHVPTGILEGSLAPLHHRPAVAHPVLAPWPPVVPLVARHPHIDPVLGLLYKGFC